MRLSNFYKVTQLERTGVLDRTRVSLTPNPLLFPLHHPVSKGEKKINPAENP